MDLNAALRGPRVYLDANVFIYALEGYERYMGALSDLFDRVDRGDLTVVTSELTLAEVLVKPMMDGDHRLVEAYDRVLQPSGSFEVAQVTRDILLQAAKIRAEIRTLRLPDAIHVATARAGGCVSLLSTDRRLSVVHEPHVVLLADCC